MDLAGAVIAVETKSLVLRTHNDRPRLSMAQKKAMMLLEQDFCLGLLNFM